MNHSVGRPRSTRRQDQARSTRRRIVLAARELFEQHGYRPTPITAISERAGVSPESIYKGFGTKAALAAAVVSAAIDGDDDPVPMHERPDADLVRAEPDLHRKIGLFAAGMARRQQRSAKVQILVRDARHGDDTLTEIWQRISTERLEWMTMLACHLLESCSLRDGIDVAEVRDVLWTYSSVELYELLVLTRGWSLDRYTDWTARAISDALS